MHVFFRYIICFIIVSIINTKSKFNIRIFSYSMLMEAQETENMYVSSEDLFSRVVLISYPHILSGSMIVLFRNKFF